MTCAERKNIPIQIGDTLEGDDGILLGSSIDINAYGDRFVVSSPKYISEIYYDLDNNIKYYELDGYYYDSS